MKGIKKYAKKVAKNDVVVIALSFLMLVNANGCSDDNVLPAQTEEGLNTFGCLVNGKLWLPEGKRMDRILNVSYGPSFMGGAFSLNVRRLKNDQDKEFMSLFSRDIDKEGNYLLNNPSIAAATYTSNVCSYDRDSTVYREGMLTITRLDLEAQIISGTFEFILAKSNCDTIRVTQGRFDMKI